MLQAELGLKQCMLDSRPMQVRQQNSSCGMFEPVAKPVHITISLSCDPAVYGWLARTQLQQR